MSTKIYGGILIDAETLDDAFFMLSALRPDALELIQGSVDKFVFQHSIDAIEEGYATGFRPDSPYLDAIRNMWDRQQKVKQTSRADNMVDFDAEIVLFRSTKIDKIPAMIFSQMGSFERWINRQPFISEYYYWDNSDPEDDMDPEEWEQRGEVWDDILTDFSPSRCGLTMKFHPSHYAPTGKVDIERRLVKWNAENTTFQRAHRIASKLLSDQRREEIFAAHPSKTAPTVTEVIETHKQIAKWLASEEGKDAMYHKADAILDEMTPITVEQVMGPA